MKKVNFDEIFADPDKRRGLFLGLVFALVLILLVCLSACNVTRTVTTTATHYQRGDTTVTIMTKTTESYDGAVKRDNFFK